jgi:hypothetical protein
MKRLLLHLVNLIIRDGNLTIKFQVMLTVESGGLPLWSFYDPQALYQSRRENMRLMKFIRKSIDAFLTDSNRSNTKCLRIQP